MSTEQLPLGRVAFGPTSVPNTARDAYGQAIIACFCLGIVIGAVIELHRIAQRLEERTLTAEAGLRTRSAQLDGALEELHRVQTEANRENKPKRQAPRARSGSGAKPASKPAP